MYLLYLQKYMEDMVVRVNRLLWSEVFVFVTVTLTVTVMSYCLTVFTTVNTKTKM